MTGLSSAIIAPFSSVASGSVPLLFFFAGVTTFFPLGGVVESSESSCSEARPSFRESSASSSESAFFRFLGAPAAFALGLSVVCVSFLALAAVVSLAAAAFLGFGAALALGF